MPIKLTEGFPAAKMLESEDIFAIEYQRAQQQDIRPLKLLLLNLMPNKIDTELQFLRLISQSPLQIDLDFMKVASHEAKNVSANHLAKYYLELKDVQDTCYDGLIITGAPVEKLAFEDVDYWEELQQIMQWSKTHVTSVIHICWGAQAGLYYHFGIDKIMYKQKLFGIYSQELQIDHRLFRGFDDRFYGPQSRYTGINEKQINPANLKIVASHPTIGATILISADDHDIFLLGHFEYDTDSLKKEYLRDQQHGLSTALPVDYFENNDVNGRIFNCWRGNAHLLYHNWINDVYQQTTFELNEIPDMLAKRREQLKNS